MQHILEFNCLVVLAAPDFLDDLAEPQLLRCYGRHTLLRGLWGMVLYGIDNIEISGPFEETPELR